MKTTKVKRSRVHFITKHELVLPPGSYTGKAGSMKMSGGITNTVTIKSVVI